VPEKSHESRGGLQSHSCPRLVLCGAERDPLTHCISLTAQLWSASSSAALSGRLIEVCTALWIYSDEIS